MASMLSGGTFTAASASGPSAADRRGAAAIRTTSMVGARLRSLSGQAREVTGSSTRFYSSFCRPVSGRNHLAGMLLMSSMSYGGCKHGCLFRTSI